MPDGGPNNDTLSGTDGPDIFFGMGGNDSASGGKGDDYFDLGTGADTATGGEGADTFVYHISFDAFGTLLSTDIPDGETITDYECNEVINLKLLLLNQTNVKLEYDQAKNNTLLRIDGNQDGTFETTLTLSGDKRGTLKVDATECGTASCGTEIRIEFCQDPATDDSKAGGSGADTQQGGKGDDTLSGGGKGDLLFGDGGDDQLSGQSGQDVIFGGRGNDSIDTGYGADAASGGAGHDTMAGRQGSDTLLGNGGRDRMDGGAGEDIVRGGTGFDLITGGAGRDTVDGGAGRDRLFGGTQADHFIFAPGYGTDRILDFQDNIDKLDLTAFHFESVQEVKTFASNVNGDLLIEFETGDLLVVANFTKLQLNPLDVLI